GSPFVAVGVSCWSWILFLSVPLFGVTWTLISTSLMWNRTGVIVDFEFENDPTEEYHEGDHHHHHHHHRHTFIPSVFEEAFTAAQQRAYLKKLIDDLTKRVDGIETGGPGAPGESITVVGYEFDIEGNTLVEFSDGSVVEVKKGRDGEPGEPGEPGKDADPLTVTSTEFNNEGDTVITFSDGTAAVVSKGQDGVDGEDGVDGADAEPLTVVGETTDDEGNTLIEFSDGSVITIRGGAGGGGSTPITVTD